MYGLSPEVEKLCELLNHEPNFVGAKQHILENQRLLHFDLKKDNNFPGASEIRKAVDFIFRKAAEKDATFKSLYRINNPGFTVDHLHIYFLPDFENIIADQIIIADENMAARGFPGDTGVVVTPKIQLECGVKPKFLEIIKLKETKVLHTENSRTLSTILHNNTHRFVGHINLPTFGVYHSSGNNFVNIIPKVGSNFEDDVNLQMKPSKSGWIETYPSINIDELQRVESELGNPAQVTEKHNLVKEYLNKSGEKRVPVKTTIKGIYTQGNLTFVDINDKVVQKPHLKIGENLSKLASKAGRIVKI